MCVPVCVIRYFSDLCHNACKSIKCEPHRARQCSLICNGITNTLQFHLWRFTHKHTDRLTDWQTDSASDKQPSGWRWHCRGRGWGGRAYQSQINEMWVPQLLPAPTVGFQLDAFCFCQLQLSLASLTRFFFFFVAVLVFISPFCAFSADQTNFAHFGMPRMQMPFLSQNYTIHHISFDLTRVKQSKRPTEHPLRPQLYLHSTSTLS